MNRFFCSIILFITIFMQVSQTDAQIWPKIYGDYFPALCNKVIEYYDHGIIIGGSIMKNSTEYKYAWVIKTDINGNELWNKKYGDGINQFYLNYCNKSTNNELICCGGTSVEDYQIDPIFIKLNACGEPDWCKILVSEGFNSATGVISVSDGYIGLLKYFGEGELYSRISLVKLDQTGEPIWIQRLAQEDSLIYNEEGGYLYLISDSNYLVSGECFYPGLRPFWIKTDTSGKQIWDLMWGGGVGGAYQVSESNNGFLYSAGGFSGPGYPITPSIFKFDLSGNAIYQKYLMGDTLIGGMADPIIVFDDSVLIAGINWRTSPNVEEGYSEIIKTDTLGNLIRRRILLNENRSPSCIISTTDNKLLISGNYVVDNNWDIYLWKMNADLEDDTLYTQPLTYDSLCPYPIVSDTVDLDCSLFVNVDEIPTKSEYESSVKIYPNPAGDWITLAFPDNLNPGPVEIQLFNSLGQAVIKTTAQPMNRISSLQVSNLSPGLYFLIATDRRNQVFRGKFVKGR